MKIKTAKNIEASKEAYRRVLEDAYIKDGEGPAHPMFTILDENHNPLLYGSYVITGDKEHQRKMEALACVLWAGLDMADCIVFNVDAFLRTAGGEKPSDEELQFKGVMVTTGCDKDDPDPVTIFEEYTIRDDEVVFEKPMAHDETQSVLAEAMKRAPDLFSKMLVSLQDELSGSPIPINSTDAFVEANKMFHDLGGHTQPSDEVWNLVTNRLEELMEATSE